MVSPAALPQDALPCDLCGSTDLRSLLRAPRLAGPLVECRRCGFRFVARSSSTLAFGGGASAATVERIREANASFEPLPRDEERRLNELNAAWRLEHVTRFRSSGRLLEVGCARGDFLRVARSSFEVCGVEPNPDLARDARAEAPVHVGLLEDAPWSGFDVVASFHVIEHVDSPRRLVAEMVRRLTPDGVLVIETPDIGSLPFRIWRSRWRQLIPEHYSFFDRQTLTRLLEDHGLAVRRCGRIGKYASADFLANRLSRHLPVGRLGARLGGLAKRVGARPFRIDPRDIMLAVAEREAPGGGESS